jgi:hypothetical protein
MSEPLQSLAENANSIPTKMNIFTKLVYYINYVISYPFNYIRGDDNQSPTFFTKIILVIVTYFVLNIVIGIVTTIIPIYYSTYKNNYANFNAFLNKQFTAFKKLPYTRILETSGDDKTDGILAFYPVVLDFSKNTATNFDEYKKFIQTNKDGSKLITSAEDYFLGLPEQFQTYVKNLEIYTVKAIQFWILMICTIILMS